MMDYIITGTGLTLISIIITLIIDRKISKKFIISLIITPIAATIATKFIWEPLGGLIPALFTVYIVYFNRKNAVYATFLSFITYTTYNLADSILGIIYMDVFKIKLLKHLSGAQPLVTYLFIVCIISIILAFIIRIIINNRIKIKEVDLDKGAEIAVYVITFTIFIFQLGNVQFNKSTGVQSESIKITLFVTTLIVICFMYMFYYFIQRYTKKTQKAIRIKNESDKLTKEERTTILSNINKIGNKKLEDAIRDLLK